MSSAGSPRELPPHRPGPHLHWAGPPADDDARRGRCRGARSVSTPVATIGPRGEDVVDGHERGKPRRLAGKVGSHPAPHLGDGVLGARGSTSRNWGWSNVASRSAGDDGRDVDGRQPVGERPSRHDHWSASSGYGDAGWTPDHGQRTVPDRSTARRRGRFSSSTGQRRRRRDAAPDPVAARPVASADDGVRQQLVETRSTQVALAPGSCAPAGRGVDVVICARIATMSSGSAEPVVQVAASPP